MFLRTISVWKKSKFLYESDRLGRAFVVAAIDSCDWERIKNVKNSVKYMQIQLVQVALGKIQL